MPACALRPGERERTESDDSTTGLYIRLRAGAKGTVIAAERVKNGRAHTVPLTAQMRAILDQRPRTSTSDFVFGRDTGRGFTGWSSSKSNSTSGWRSNPGRRMICEERFATGACELGIAPHVGGDRAQPRQRIPSRHRRHCSERHAFFAVVDPLSLAIAAPTAATIGMVMLLSGCRCRGA